MQTATLIPALVNGHLDYTMSFLPSCRQRTAIEYQKLVEAAGFTLSQIIPTKSIMNVSVMSAGTPKIRRLPGRSSSYDIYRNANDTGGEVLWSQLIVSVRSAAMES